RGLAPRGVEPPRRGGPAGRLCVCQLPRHRARDHLQAAGLDPTFVGVQAFRHAAPQWNRRPESGLDAAARPGGPRKLDTCNAEAGRWRVDVAWTDRPRLNLTKSSQRLT